MIKVETESYRDKPDPDKFRKLHKVMEDLYPNVFKKCKKIDMGITKRTEVYMRKVAPLGDPVEIFVRGYDLTLRKADAQMIEVEEI